MFAYIFLAKAEQSCILLSFSEQNFAKLLTQSISEFTNGTVAIKQ